MTSYMRRWTSCSHSLAAKSMSSAVLPRRPRRNHGRDGEVMPDIRPARSVRSAISGVLSRMRLLIDESARCSVVSNRPMVGLIVSRSSRK